MLAWRKLRLPLLHRGKRGEAGAAAYCASKFGLLGVVECFAVEMARTAYGSTPCAGKRGLPMLRQVAEAEAARDGTDVEQVLASYAAGAASGRWSRGRSRRGSRVAGLPIGIGITGESVNIDAGALTS